MRRGWRECGLVELDGYILILCACSPANRSFVLVEGDATMNKFEDPEGKTVTHLRIVQREFRPRPFVTMGAAGHCIVFRPTCLSRLFFLEIFVMGDLLIRCNGHVNRPYRITG